MNEIPIFTEYSLGQVLHGLNEHLAKFVAEVPPDDLLDNRAAVVEALEKKLRVNPLVLDEKGIAANRGDTRIDVSQDVDRMIFDRSQPFLVDALRITYFVPYTGDQPLWKYQPATFLNIYPRVARIEPNELVLEYDRPDRDVLTADKEFKGDLALIKQYLGYAAQEIEVYNGPLRDRIEEAIRQRKFKLQVEEGELAGLGYRARENPSAAPAAALEAKTPRTTRAAAPERAVRRFQYDVALSYAGEDRKYVEAVATALAAHGVRFFYDKFETSKLWGRNLIEHFAKVYGNGSRFIVLFISVHYASKAWPTFERRQALARAIKEPKEVVILPVRLDDTPLDELSSTHYLDGRETTPAEVAAMIVDKVKGAS